MAKQKQQIVTTYKTQVLYDELVVRGLNPILEYSDGHKHVDIALLAPKIYIEVDGYQHYTDPNQIERDFKRNHYSDGDDFDTLHVPNEVLEHHLKEIADAIVEVVFRRTKH